MSEKETTNCCSDAKALESGCCSTSDGATPIVILVKCNNVAQCKPRTSSSESCCGENDEKSCC